MNNASGYVVGLCAKIVLVVVGFLMLICLVCAVGSIAGCSSPVVVKPQTVEVDKFVVVPIPEALLRSCDVAEPPKDCKRSGKADFCNGTLSALLDMYRLATHNCSDDKIKIRDLSTGGGDGQVQPRP